MRDRLDKLLVTRGILKSRELAKAYILEGKVFVDGKKITKAGTLVKDSSEIFLKDKAHPFVSRGGIKLQAAIRYFRINLENKVVMDVGASTGGFTDCLLKIGAKKVYCIDVGYGQLALSLRNNDQVIVMERTNIRYLDEIVKWIKSLSNNSIQYKENFYKIYSNLKGKDISELINSSIDIATVDVSFISLKKVLPVVSKFVKKEGEILALIKPQFEVGKGKVGKGGIIKEEKQRIDAVQGVKVYCEEIGLKTIGIFQSPITGQKGNIEYFIYIKR